jgi:hypothetical protein
MDSSILWSAIHHQMPKKKYLILDTKYHFSTKHTNTMSVLQQIKLSDQDTYSKDELLDTLQQFENELMKRTSIEEDVIDWMEHMGTVLDNYVSDKQFRKNGDPKMKRTVFLEDHKVSKSKVEAAFSNPLKMTYGTYMDLLFALGLLKFFPIAPSLGQMHLVDALMIPDKEIRGASSQLKRM